MTPTPPTSRWRRLARRVVSIHPPWWASVWFILLGAGVWFYTFVASTSPPYSRSFIAHVPLEQRLDGTWHAVARHNGPPVTSWNVAAFDSRGLIWTKTTLSAFMSFEFPLETPPTSAPPMPTNAQAAAAWLAADDEVRAASIPNGHASSFPVTHHDAVHAIAEGRDTFFSHRWAYEIAVHTWWLSPAAVAVAAFLFAVRRRRRRTLKNIVRIISENECARCHYSLKGLAANSACPECGADNQLIRQAAFAELDPPGTRAPLDAVPNPKAPGS